DSRVRKSVQPFGLDDLERLVDEGGRVDRDLRAHVPGGMRPRLFGRERRQRLFRAAAERSPTGGEHETRYGLDSFPRQALPDGRMLAVDRAKAVERVAAYRLELARDERPPGDERLLVGERNGLPCAKGRQDRGQRGHA